MSKCQGKQPPTDVDPQELDTLYRPSPSRAQPVLV